MRLRHPWLALSLVLLLSSSTALATGFRPPGFGEFLRGLTADERAEAEEGLEEFAEVDDEEEGLGPVFNGNSCAACHTNPVIGGDSNILETRFGFTHPVTKAFNPLTELGGSLKQDFGLDDTGPCAGETIPPQANTVARRKTTPLFGLGLIEAVPDGELEGIARLQARFSPQQAGRVHWVTDVATGAVRAGRFGWKNQVATLLTFSGDAYINEMGITNPLFPDEQRPNGSQARLDACRTTPAGVLEDDGTAIAAFTAFMTALAPPPRGPIGPKELWGAVLFRTTGCDTCHVPTLVTGAHEVDALTRQVFHPFSDFLLHDMGRLGDGIVQGQAKAREMRTAPLWGLSVRTAFLHDGRATTLRAAIMEHDGQGSQSRGNFIRLTALQQGALLAYLKSL